MQEKPSRCASVCASVQWGELRSPLSTLQVGIPARGSDTVRHLGRGSCHCTLTPRSGAGEVCTGMGEPPGKGCVGSDRRGAKAQEDRGTRCRLASSTSVGAGREPRRGISEGDMLWVSLPGARGPWRDRQLGKWSVYAKQTEELCGRRGGAGGGVWERKSCVGKISVLWLLFEAVLAALGQTAGLGKNTPQTGREAAEFSGRPLTANAPALPSQASAHGQSPRPGPRRTLLLGGSRHLK